MSDTGLGIPQHERQQVFERFYRTEQSYANAIQGSGLGLSIVADIVERHSGTVWFESAPSTGTTFFMQFPGVEPEHAHETEAVSIG